MQVVNIEDVLSKAPQPLTFVKLHALEPVRAPYRVLLLQPQGVVEANESRIGHADSKMAYALCRDFLVNATKLHADLVVAPEYCVPWTVVSEIAEGKLRPAPGGIWVLGCESIMPNELQETRARFNQSGSLFFYHEPLDARQVEQKRYVDPLLYVFWSKNSDDGDVLCMVVQFKTVACKDYLDVEQKALYLGRDIYVFNRGMSKMGLMSIICSDAFEFTPLVDEYHVNCLMIHIQLNPKPAHVDYAAYRIRLCSVGSNSHVELLCLNWAENVRELTAPGQYSEWNNVAGSAWYVPPAKFSGDDSIIDELHKYGLYYSLLKARWHSFFVNYQGAVILLQKQKLMFTGEQAIAPKSCLSVIGRWTWSNSKGAWDIGCPANDGFSLALTAYKAAAGPLQRASQASPLAVERALEVLVGPKGRPTSWYTVNELEAIHLDLDEESIRRVTVHQEVSLGRPGVVFRKQRLQRANDAIGLPGCKVPWPIPVRDLEQGFEFSWEPGNPYYNVTPSVGNQGSAGLVYLADEADDNVIETLLLKLTEGLVTHAVTAATRAGKRGPALNDVIVRSQDRLCVVFRRGNTYLARGPQDHSYNKPVERSQVDYTRE